MGTLYQGMDVPPVARKKMVSLVNGRQDPVKRYVGMASICVSMSVMMGTLYPETAATPLAKSRKVGPAVGEIMQKKIFAMKFAVMD